MKKTITKLLGIILCVMMIVSSVGVYTAGNVIAAENTIYVSDSGNDESSGLSIDKAVKTLSKASTLAGNDGTVIVIDSVNVSPSEQISGCTITGLNTNAVINLTGWAMRMKGAATIENVTLNAKAAWSYILAQGHRLVIGEGVTVTADPGITTALSIRGGGDGMEMAGSCEVVIKSGAWKGVVGGTRNKDTNGNTHVTVYDSATVSTINMGNENAADVTSTVFGSATVKLVGSSNPIPGNITGTVAANKYIDLTEYDGPIPASWKNSGAIILEDVSKIPVDAKPASEGGVVGASGTVYDTGSSDSTELTGKIIYLSDNGSDNGDGTSITTAVKTLAKANQLVGEGGTIIISDTYTHKTADKIVAAKLEGFTQDCILDIGSWRFDLGANCTIDNLTLNVSYNWAFILCNGFTLNVGENVKTTKSGNANVPLSIRGGGEGSSVAGNTNITLKSGEWGSVIGGTKKGSINGNTTVTVYPGATINTASAGNDGSVEGNIIAGVGTIKVVGAKHGIAKINGSDIIKGGTVLDVTEYTGSDLQSLSNMGSEAGYAIYKDKNVKPEIIVPEAPKVEIPTTGIPTSVKPGDGVIYLSARGNDTNDGKTAETPKKTLANAIKAGGANPIIVVVDSYVFDGASTVPACTLTGYTSDSRFSVDSWAMRLAGDMTIENITLVALQKYSYILAQSNNLTIGENVTTVKGDGVTTFFGIRGGSEGAAVNSKTNVVIKSGEWGDVHGGTRNASVYANTFLTVYEGATIASLNIGNNGTKEENVYEADGVIKLVGNPKVSSVIAKPTYCTGTMYLDLTEFTGTAREEWSKLGASIITAKNELPDFIKNHYEALNGEYDLSGLSNFRFISDSGDDANDGLTRDKPMKSIRTAVSAMGEGGTVVVTGAYTLNEYTSGLPSFNITSACNKDSFIMQMWALHTNNTKIYNLNLVVPKNYNFILHCGKPLHIGKNVNCTLSDGATVHVGIRGNESGDVAMTDVTVESGTWSNIFTGTKNANVLGNAKITVSGGTIGSITAANDSSTGRILGNTIITLKDKPLITTVNYKEMCDGYAIVDISEFTGIMPNINTSFNIIEEKNLSLIPLNINSVFINGYPDGTFLPENVMTRAEAITVVSKIAGLTTVSELPETTLFTDLKPDDWYAANVKYLESLDVLSFWGTTLDASKGITRGEFVKLISNMIKPNDGEASVFTDVTESHPYYNEITNAAKAGLVTGYPDGTFLPDNTLKRSEIVTILNRLTERKIITANTSKIAKFSDIAGHWAESQIIAASCAADTDGMKLWYSGEVFGANNAVSDKTAIDLSTTKTVLEGVNVNDTNAVANAIEAYAVKRREEIANTPTSVNVTGTKYYVSSGSGDDANDGKSPETAWQTLTRVNNAELAEGDGVFFKRGEIFRGQLKTRQGVTYSAYGEGKKPALYGSEKNYANIGFWQPTNKPNVYVSSEAFSADVGLIVFDEGKQWCYKEILGIKGFVGALTYDLQMYHDQNDRKLYLYSTSDPNTRWSSIEIAPGQNGVTGVGHNVTLDNLTIKYSGAHGVGYGDGTTGLTVQNCEIGWIGGMLQNTDRIVRYGNGVEIYVSCKDYTITNSHIYQCYDAGVTHQYFQTKDDYVNMENIKYTDNVIEYCTYNIEYVNAQAEKDGVMKNVDISGNLLIHGGEGWGQQRSDNAPAVIKGWSHVNHAINAVYTDNVIMTMAENCHLVHLGVSKLSYIPELYGNIFVAKNGTRFGIYGYINSTALTYDEKLTNITIGLDDNTLVFMN